MVKEKGFRAKDVAKCIAVLDSIASWSDLSKEPTEYDGSQDEPGSALAARKVLIEVGYRNPDGTI